MKGKHKGHLILSPTGIRFESLVRSAELWELPYTSLLRLEKVGLLPIPIQYGSRKKI